MKSSKKFPIRNLQIAVRKFRRSQPSIEIRIIPNRHIRYQTHGYAIVEAGGNESAEIEAIAEIERLAKSAPPVAS